MKNSTLLQAIIAIFAFIIFSCSNDSNYTQVEESPVIMDLSAVPYPKLSDYHFFDGEMNDQTPSYGVIPFKPTSELFSDYALKKRFIWLPHNTMATYNGDHDILQLPVGAALVKTFYFENVHPSMATKIIETRVMIHQATGWIFADYVWNAEQTEAFLQMEGSTVPIEFMDNQGNSHTVDYEIPSENKCTTCHTKDEGVFPIGIKPQNLNSNYNYAEGTKNQLDKLVEFGYLEDNLPTTISSVTDYNNTAQSLDLRVRSYFDINCAHCHRDGGSADYVALRFAFDQTTMSENMGVCVGTTTAYPGIAHGQIVKPNDIGQSVLHYVMNTNNTFYRMPRLGRTVVHTEGVALVTQWINSLQDCE